MALSDEDKAEVIGIFKDALTSDDLKAAISGATDAKLDAKIKELGLEGIGDKLDGFKKTIDALSDDDGKGGGKGKNKPGGDLDLSEAVKKATEPLRQQMEELKAAKAEAEQKAFATRRDSALRDALQEHFGDNTGLAFKTFAFDAEFDTDDDGNPVVLRKNSYGGTDKVALKDAAADFAKGDGQRLLPSAGRNGTGERGGSSGPARRISTVEDAEKALGV